LLLLLACREADGWRPSGCPEHPGVWSCHAPALPLLLLLLLLLHGLLLLLLLLVHLPLLSCLCCPYVLRNLILLPIMSAALWLLLRLFLLPVLLPNPSYLLTRLLFLLLLLLLL
jgi:hypothetical protein